MQVIESTAAIPGQYWEWRGQQIYYVKAGRRGDRPPLLLVHGFGASTDHWRKNVVGLSDEFEVWAIDLLGFGRSAKPDWRVRIFNDASPARPAIPTFFVA